MLADDQTGYLDGSWHSVSLGEPGDLIDESLVLAALG